VKYSFVLTLNSLGVALPRESHASCMGKTSKGSKSGVST
jgi:hypothetical protein